MTNDPESIRAALEPHGYRPMLASDGVAMQDSDGMIVQWSERLQDYCHGWDTALTHFTNDKSQTGARIADLGAGGHAVFIQKQSVSDGLQWFASCRVDNESHGTVTSDPDEAIARLWLKVKGLEDPRGDA